MATKGIKITNAGAQVVEPLNKQPTKPTATAIRGTDLRTGK